MGYAEAGQEERIFAFDISQSVTNSMRRWMGATAEEGLPLPIKIASSFLPPVRKKPRTGVNGSRRTAPIQRSFSR